VPVGSNFLEKVVVVVEEADKSCSWATDGVLDCKTAGGDVVAP
jgi:hypothetical protein